MELWPTIKSSQVNFISDPGIVSMIYKKQKRGKLYLSFEHEHNSLYNITCIMTTCSQKTFGKIHWNKNVHNEQGMNCVAQDFVFQINCQ